MIQGHRKQKYTGQLIKCDADLLYNVYSSIKATDHIGDLRESVAELHGNSAGGIVHRPGCGIVHPQNMPEQSLLVRKSVAARHRPSHRHRLHVLRRNWWRERMAAFVAF